MPKVSKAGLASQGRVTKAKIVAPCRLCDKPPHGRCVLVHGRPVCRTCGNRLTDAYLFLDQEFGGVTDYMGRPANG
jgi:hypothetical protein